MHNLHIHDVQGTWKVKGLQLQTKELTLLEYMLSWNQKVIAMFVSVRLLNL